MVVSEYYRALLRMKINHNNIKRLKNKDFTIISQNCVGGVILHELNQRFNSPTINLFFSSRDFLLFLSDMRHYLSLEMQEKRTPYSYPVGNLGGLTVHFMHYGSFQEAKDKWKERINRINYNNMYVMMVQGKDCTDDMVEQFDALPFEKKVIFVGKPYHNIKSAVYIPGTELDDGSVTNLCLYKSKLTGRRLLDDYDYVSFLNS